jgi:hypothetical protein
MRHVLVPLSSVLLGVAACGGHDSGLIDGFHPALAQAGFTRYVLPPVRGVPAGQQILQCQWVSAPVDHDVDIIATAGEQTTGGHHAILYASTEAAPIGTSRECNYGDLASVRYLGGIGGEGTTGAAANLPPGVAYRLRKGFALMVNTHYINATEAPMDGQTVLDVKYADVDPSRLAASMFTNLDTNDIVIPANQHFALDVNCTMKQDIPLFLFGNHMHKLGTSIFTEVTHAATMSKEPVIQDPTWTEEFVFNPRVTTWPPAAPYMLKQGDTLHTHCEWNNTGSDIITFPTEMCVGFGFFVGEGDEINCISNDWTK